MRTVLLATCLAAPVQAKEITVFAAASLGDALEQAAQGWEEHTGHAVTLVLAGTSTLARQIDAGAPADVFVSANVDWMDWLSTHERIDAQSRRDIASNRLVLIAHDRSAQSDTVLTEATDLTEWLGTDGRLAIALPEAVPAGVYGKAALTQLGLWDAVASRLAPTDNVRAALALVALGEAPLGIVYETDALAEKGVTVAATFPDTSHPPIRYAAAVVADSANPELAAGFLSWLVSGTGQAALAAHGFLPPKAMP
ncbi:molybdate ABC transporter substrate-binding protein [Marivita sp. S6314]|uniref:molybdate ABC transporter substrate-binding protein n=1 Tax=Marivita sp. S6314 TaxID=2926406 RepID=UPI001FF67416|nr:molybdate ABC transporter substrate-binding protein [Marivita sp. S6314]